MSRVPNRILLQTTIVPTEDDWSIVRFSRLSELLASQIGDDGERAYQVAKEVLRKHPDLTGFQGSSSLDVIGIGRAVEEAGKVGKICVYGTGLPTDAAVQVLGKTTVETCRMRPTCGRDHAIDPQLRLRPAINYLGTNSALELSRAAFD